MSAPGVDNAIPAGTLMQGKRGLIMGVANNRSIAWGIAKAVAAQGATLAFTYQGDALKKRVEPLAAEVGSKLVLPCDVTDKASMDAVFAELAQKWGKLDFLVHAIAFSDKAELDGRYVDTTEKNFTQTMLISCYSFTALAQRAEKLMTAGGSMLTLTYYGAEKVMPHYNVMGVAKAALEASVRYLAADLGRNNIRVNAISAGPIKTLAASGIADFRYILQLERVQLGAAAHGDDRGGGGVGPVFPVGPVARRHRRGAPRRCRLPRAGHEERGRARHLRRQGCRLRTIAAPDALCVQAARHIRLTSWELGRNPSAPPVSPPFSELSSAGNRASACRSSERSNRIRSWLCRPPHRGPCTPKRALRPASFSPCPSSERARLRQAA